VPVVTGMVVFKAVRLVSRAIAAIACSVIKALHDKCSVSRPASRYTADMVVVHDTRRDHQSTDITAHSPKGVLEGNSNKTTDTCHGTDSCIQTDRLEVTVVRHNSQVLQVAELCQVAVPCMTDMILYISALLSRISTVFLG
jgi:hypothetical protein